MLFSRFFRFSRTRPHDLAVHRDFHKEGLVVIRPFFTAELVSDILRPVSLKQFLEIRFVIFPVYSLIYKLQVFIKLLQNKITGRRIGTIYINRADDGFESISHNAVTRPASRESFAFAEKEKISHMKGRTNAGKRFFTDHTGSCLGQVPFRHIRITAKEVFTDHHIQDGIAQEFQPFIVYAVMRSVFIRIGRMSKRLIKKMPIVKGRKI